MIKTNRAKTSTVTTKRDDLNALMEAVALIIARRQMKRHWATSRAL
jgi:hypothetical protein